METTPQIAPTYDCAPTLTDREVFEFCRQGYLILEGVVPDEINQQTMSYIAGHTEHQPMELLTEPWFVDGIFKNPAAAGAVRSLLGADFKLPQNFCNHRVECPAPAQGWHRDGGSIYTEQLDYLQVFYYPQEVMPEMGPTELIPGSHFMRGKANYMAHLRNLRLAEKTTAPAGTIFLTVYSIWHRKGPSTASCIRNMFKYNYWRSRPPRRDWIVDPDFDLSWPNTGGSPHFEQFKLEIEAARLFSWLCNEDYEHTGGQCWPCGAPEKLACDQEGLPTGLRRYQ